MVTMKKYLTPPSFTPLQQPVWQRFNDGWFDYWVCSVCGKRSWTKEPQCPVCKSHMINGDKKH